MNAIPQAPIAGMNLSSQPPTPSALARQPTQEAVFGLLKQPILRLFKVDIETDSTIAGDESQEKQDRTTFIESMTKFMEAWGPMVVQKPELSALAGQLLLFGVRAFRVGRELEEIIEETADRMAANVQPGPKPGDAKVQAEQIKLQATQAKTQAEIQKAQVDAQTGQQAAAAKLQEIIAESQAKMRELQMKLAEAAQGHQHKAAEAQMAHGAAMDQMALEGQRQQAAQMPKWPVDPAKTQGF
jgi:hypothetical protein